MTKKEFKKIMKKTMLKMMRIQNKTTIKETCKRAQLSWRRLFKLSLPLLKRQAKGQLPCLFGRDGLMKIKELAFLRFGLLALTLALMPALSMHCGGSSGGGGGGDSASAPPDADGDGTPDSSDAFPNDECASTDSDGDGFPDSIADNCEAGDTELVADAMCPNSDPTGPANMDDPTATNADPDNGRLQEQRGHGRRQ